MASTRERSGSRSWRRSLTAEVGTAQRAPAGVPPRAAAAAFSGTTRSGSRRAVLDAQPAGLQHAAATGSYKCGAHAGALVFKSVYAARAATTPLCSRSRHFEKIGCKEITVLMALPPATAPFTDQDFRDLDQALGITTQPSVDRDVIKGDQRNAEAVDEPDPRRARRERWRVEQPARPILPLSDRAALTSPAARGLVHRHVLERRARNSRRRRRRTRGGAELLPNRRHDPMGASLNDRQRHLRWLA